MSILDFKHIVQVAMSRCASFVKLNREEKKKKVKLKKLEME